MESRMYRAVIDEQRRVRWICAPTYQAYVDWCDKNDVPRHSGQHYWVANDTDLRGLGHGAIIVLLPGYHKVVHEEAIVLAMYAGALVRES